MKRFLGPALILLCTVIWGAAFLAQKLGADHFGPFALTASRNLLAAAVLLGAIACRNRFVARARRELGSTRIDPHWNRPTVLGGAISGVCLFVAMLAQQLGIEHTTPGVSAFLTANYILIVPIFAWVVGKGCPGLFIWIGVVLALFGSFLISIGVADDWSGIGPGELWTLACAVLFAVQIMVVDHFAAQADMLAFSFVQMLVAGLVALPFVLLPGEWARLSLADFTAGLPALLFLGVLSSGVAYTLQNLGQARTPPALAALIMSMESVFGALFGWMIRGDVLSDRQLWGCALVFAAVILSQLRIVRLKTSV